MRQSLFNGDNNPPKGKLSFRSNTHQRYENGTPVLVEQINCNREIIIEKNISGDIGYTVSINNPDGIPGTWGATPMGGKKMKIVSVTSNKIEMRGYGYDTMAVAMGIPMDAASFENYGITLYHDGQDITRCILHKIANNVDIDYYNK